MAFAAPAERKQLAKERIQMIRSLIILLLATSTASATQMERCEYDTLKPDGTIVHTVESPSPYRSNAERFSHLIHLEEIYEFGYAGYSTFDVKCRPLNSEKPEYHLFVQTRNGQVSLQHGLTEDACYYVLEQLDSSRWHCPAKMSCTSYPSDSDFEHGECFK